MDALATFRATARRLYPEKMAGSLCVIEYIVRTHEGRTGRPVTDFGGYLAATYRSAQPLSFDRESRTWYKAWQRVRREVFRAPDDRSSTGL